MYKRNYGIDLLKIIIMFMVVLLHILDEGGVLSNTVKLSDKYWIAWFLECAAFCAVNCFAIISGFVMHNSTAKISRILALWLQIVFYSLITTCILWVADPSSVSINSIITAVFPITRKQYWYLSAYFGMYIFVPLLNLIIEKCERQILKRIFILIFIFMCVIPTGMHSDPYNLNSGYSTAWLCLLYLLGGYIEKYNILSKLKKMTSMFLFWISIIVSICFKALIEYCITYVLGNSINISFGGWGVISYLSPTIILAAVFLISYFSKLNFSWGGVERIIKLLSNASLGVYIIHCSPFVWNKVISDAAVPFLKYNCVIMGILVILCAFLIWLICSCIDIIRIYIFKLFRVEFVCKKIACAINSKITFS